jgi:hypothetical protein
MGECGLKVSALGHGLMAFACEDHSDKGLIRPRVHFFMHQMGTLIRFLTIGQR